jgi:hypothetical protein
LVLAPGTSEDDWPFGQECGACGKFFSTRQKLSTVATDTIAYVITDQNGLAATRTRTVIVGPAAAPSIALMHRLPPLRHFSLRRRSVRRDGRRALEPDDRAYHMFGKIFQFKPALTSLM